MKKKKSFLTNYFCLLGLSEFLSFSFFFLVFFLYIFFFFLKMFIKGIFIILGSKRGTLKPQW
jgi:hypothetical protein